MSFELSLSAGILAAKTVAHPGAHGAAVAGIQGIGVKTPIAADVADATVGFAKEVHIAKVITFTRGLLSIILAAGWFPTKILFTGKTTKLLGAVPKLHVINAPFVT